MATARTRPQPAKPAPKRPAAPAPDPWPLRVFDAIFRFLASLKLAVILLTSLATVLAYGTVYETIYGPQAVQLDIYQSKWFALLLAMLGVNILCAALIRFPWKKRQTGFVITHAGLLVVLVGSYLSIKLTDEGDVAIPEGGSSSTYVREDYPVVRVEPLDPHTGRPTTDAPFTLPFRPGAAAWESEHFEQLIRRPGYEAGAWAAKLAVACLGLVFFVGAGVIWWRWSAWVNRPLGALVLALVISAGAVILACSWSMPVGPRRDVLSEPDDPFRLVVKDYIPSATPPRPRREAAEDGKGVPMLRASLMVQPPGAAEPFDAWRGSGWMVATPNLKRGARADDSDMPLEVAFQVLDGPLADLALTDFLDIPQSPLIEHRARFHYRDRSGAPRRHDWTFTRDQMPKEGDTLALPESDLVATFVRLTSLPTGRAGEVAAISPDFAELLEEVARATQKSEIPVLMFRVKQGDGPDEVFLGWGGLPLAPNPLAPAGRGPSSLMHIDYYHPPNLGAGHAGVGPMGGLMGTLEIVASPDGLFYYRALGREGLKGLGPIKLGDSARLFGGERMPMQVAVRLDEYLRSGRTRYVCEKQPLPAKFMKDAANPAALVEMTVGGVTREAWLYHSREQGALPEVLSFPSGFWRVSLGYDQRALDFIVDLIDFDSQFDPGATSRSTFRSDVTVRPLGSQRPAKVPFAELAQGRYFQFVDRPRETFRKLSATTYEPFDGGEIVTVDKPESVVQPSDDPKKIYMNNPMEYGGWTFFQSQFRPVRDPQTGQPTGQQISIFSIRHDPAGPVIYGGTFIVLIGVFVQFYMRAGVFSDGGKRERERAEQKRDKTARPEPALSQAEVEEEL